MPSGSLRFTVAFMMNGPAVKVDDLWAYYRRRSSGRRNGEPFAALRSLHLHVARGHIHGLLGPNGAGKTTLCRVLATQLLPARGSVRVLDHDVVRDVRQVRRRIGIVFGGDRGLYPRLTARQNLHFWAALYQVPGRERRELAACLLARVGLGSRADDRVETYSRGMRQRLHLARGLVGDPELLLLDEPTTGMDPVAALEFRTLVAALRDEGRTILLATHNLVEAEQVCDQVTVVSDGVTLASGPPAELSAGGRALEDVYVALVGDRGLVVG